MMRRASAILFAYAALCLSCKSVGQLAYVTTGPELVETSECNKKGLLAVRVEDGQRRLVEQVYGGTWFEIQPGSYRVFYRLVSQEIVDGRCRMLEEFNTHIQPFVEISIDAGRRYLLKRGQDDQVLMEEIEAGSREDEYAEKVLKSAY